MVILDISYLLKIKESIQLDSKQKNKNINWKFLDNRELKINNKFFINDSENNVYHELNLYKKRNNLHIFSCCSSYTFDFFGLDYYYYLIWINSTNVYCLIQNNKKNNKIKENNNNIFMENNHFENLLDGLFFNKPIYYLDSTSRCKSIKKLEILPIYPYKIIIKNECDLQPTEINGLKVIPHQLVECVPI